MGFSAASNNRYSFSSSAIWPFVELRSSTNLLITCCCARIALSREDSSLANISTWFLPPSSADCTFCSNASFFLALLSLILRCSRSSSSANTIGSSKSFLLVIASSLSARESALTSNSKISLKVASALCLSALIVMPIISPSLYSSWFISSCKAECSTNSPTLAFCSESRWSIACIISLWILISCSKSVLVFSNVVAIVVFIIWFVGASSKFFLSVASFCWTPSNLLVISSDDSSVERCWIFWANFSSSISWLTTIVCSLIESINFGSISKSLTFCSNFSNSPSLSLFSKSNSLTPWTKSLSLFFLKNFSIISFAGFVNNRSLSSLVICSSVLPFSLAFLTSSSAFISCWVVSITSIKTSRLSNLL